MADPKCPDCHDPTVEHRKGYGCCHQRKGTSGRLVICWCTRVFPEEDA